jgi:beta-lactamase regulating signal transducer with metallopeptidase domain
MMDGALITIGSFGTWTVAATWLLTYWLHAAVVATLALTARRYIATPILRVSLARAALVVPFFTATVAMRTGARAADSWWSTAPTIASVIGPRARGLEVDQQVTRIGDRVVQSARIVDPVGRSDARIVCLLFGVVGVAGLLPFAWRRSRARHSLGTRAPTSVDHAPSLLAGVRLTSSPRVDTAIAIGPREICVPSTFGTLPEPERRAVLLHELAHLERRDPRWQDIGSSIAAATWLLPFNRVLVHAMRRDAEFVADARALALGADSRALVAALERYARSWDSAPVALAGSPFTRRSSLVIARAERALAPDAPSHQPAWQLASRAAIVIALALAAARLPLVTSAAPVTSDRGQQAESRVVIQTQNR